MKTSSQSYYPEIWGGLECTINRVGDSFRDQLTYAGHYERNDDFDLIAKLGIKKLRFPVLWEAHQHVSKNEKINWAQTTLQLEKLKNYSITPIAGLLHHGSGPAFTSLLHNNFAEDLAGYATKVAQKFPWLEFYTPVNEPLTTARFSGLYGYWYPHHKDELAFAKMFLNQLKGIVLSMKAIRKINGNARLVQTEDLTSVHSTAALQYQADFENERRWLTYDFLCGKVNPDHFFWNYLLALGINENLLKFFPDNACPPDIAGLNYYVTSERFLDDKIHLYPGSSHGGNGREAYADVAAVRSVKPAGLSSLLLEAWERYKIPLAVTEVHINCTREEQLRWFKEAWDNCCSLKKKGIPVTAVTAWSLLGAFDWNSLLTREDRIYETGAYDITNNTLRPTALAKLIQSLAKNGTWWHAVTNEKGWWHKSYPGHKNILSSEHAVPLLIIGSNGTLGGAFAKICERRSIPYVALSQHNFDITKNELIEKAIDKWKPWAIINAAGYVKVDDAELDLEKCFNLNAEAPGSLATICKYHGIQLMNFSSDLVFDGEKQAPYKEFDRVKPLNIYGQSKARCEELVLKNFPSSLIIRTSAFFGPWDKYNFAFNILNSLKERTTCNVVKDVIISPTYVPHLVDKALDLLIDEEKGIWHVTNEGMLTWHEFAEEIASRGGFRKKNIVPCLQEEMDWKARRPSYSVLQSDKGIKLPAVRYAIEKYFEEKNT